VEWSAVCYILSASVFYTIGPHPSRGYLGRMEET
jgi:hypothetical protein